MSETEKFVQALGNFIQEPEIGLKRVTINRFRENDSESFFTQKETKLSENDIQSELNISEQKIIDFFENKSTNIILIDAVKDFYNKSIFEHLEKFLLKSDTNKWLSGEKGYFLEVNFGKDNTGKTIITKLKLTKNTEKFEQVESEIAESIKKDNDKQKYLEQNGIFNRIKTMQERMKLKQKISLETFQKSLEELNVSQKKVLGYIEENFKDTIQGNSGVIETSLSEKNKEILGEYIYHAAVLYLYENQYNKNLFEKGVSIFSRDSNNTNNYKLRVTIKRRQNHTPFYIEKVELTK